MPLDAESLFRTYLLPLYPPELAADLGRARTADANPANNPHIVAHLEEAADVFTGMGAALFGEDVRLDRTPASIHRLGAALTRERRDLWASRGEAGSADNELFNVIVHGVAYLGATIVAANGGAWRVRSPLWESRVHLVSAAGEAEIALLQWWLKSLADDALESDGRDGSTSAGGLGARYRLHVEEPTRDHQARPRFFDPERKLPRMAKVRYDLFYKYLKTHLPELRDVGTSFPSPERFDEMGFSWLDFLVLGEGRALLVYGLGVAGLHLFWMGPEGFEKALFYPADSFPAPLVRVRGGRLEVHLSVDKQTTFHEMLWPGI
jgi:hypothetical protein